MINLLGEKTYYELYIEPTIKQFISRRFENIVRDYFSILSKQGYRKDIKEIGSLFTSNSEFDCVLKLINNDYAIYEAKYLSNPISKQEIRKEILQIKDIKGINVKEIGFVCSSGYKDKIDDVKYLDLEDILFIK